MKILFYSTKRNRRNDDWNFIEQYKRKKKTNTVSVTIFFSSVLIFEDMIYDP